MRKVLSTLLIAGALGMALASVASGAPGVRCTHKSYCSRPTIATRSLPAACRAPGSTIKLPNIRVGGGTEPPGIRKITVTLGSKVLFSKSFKKPGPLTYTIKGLKVHTKGLSSGAHKIKIFARDNFGRTATRTLRFSVCKPPPFTG